MLQQEGWAPRSEDSLCLTEDLGLGLVDQLREVACLCQPEHVSMQCQVAVGGPLWVSWCRGSHLGSIPIPRE